MRISNDCSIFWHLIRDFHTIHRSLTHRKPNTKSLTVSAMSTVSFSSLILTTQTYKPFFQTLYTQTCVSPQKQNKTIQYTI